MKVEQIAEIVNQLAQENLGAAAPTVADDFSNIVDVGRATFESMPVDNYVRKLLDKVGRVVFVNRPYSGRAPSVLMAGWEYGSIMQKIDAGVPEAEDNPTWGLVNGQTYNQDKFQGPTDVVQKFWNDKVTFQVFMSTVEEQVKSAFTNITQLNAFFSMIYTKIDMAFTIRLDALIMGTINNFSANVYNAGKAINLLTLYKAINPTSTVTAATALHDLDFIKFASFQMKLYSNRLTNASKIFNIGGRVRHTPRDLQKIVMLDVFADAADVYLQSDTFHNEFTKLPNADKVSYWQYSGNSYAFEDVSSINIVPNTEEGAGTAVKVSGILAVIFDRDALGVNNMNRRVTNHYNANGEFINNWYKMDAQYFNDFNENFVMFYIADPVTPPTPTPTGNNK